MFTPLALPLAGELAFLVYLYGTRCGDVTLSHLELHLQVSDGYGYSRVASALDL